MPAELTPLERVYEIVGNRAQVAHRLGINPWAVYKWNVERPPRDRCLDLELMTNKKVKAEELRPDVNWQYERKQQRIARKGLRRSKLI